MRTQEIILTPEEAFDAIRFQDNLYAKLSLKKDGDWWVRPLKRSIDARSKRVVVRVLCEVIPASEKQPLIQYSKVFQSITSSSKRCVIVGSGPAGLFAALRLLEFGVKPIVVERGSDVRARRRDLAAINKHHIVNPDSNYCFGEGGAGTYSDGKLYTRSKKRGDVHRILEILVAHGANEEILFDAHPHIGTNRLPALIERIRASILDAGGEIHFNTRITDFIMHDYAVTGVRTLGGDTIDGDAVLLATGHSARDIFELLHHRNIPLEVKPFALGVRVEHPQELIDRIQYHCPVNRGLYLPASSYSLVHQSVVEGKQRGVFSFCMCPGGFIVPAATSPGEIVVNGMSPSRRDSRYANSGIVVSVEEPDFLSFKKFGPLAGMHFQASVEQNACKLAGGKQTAPAQRLVDFVDKRNSTSLPGSSYQPGLLACTMDEVLPPFIAEALRQGFRDFGRKMKGYLTNEAQIVGVESRTSSPVRIPRDSITLQHPRVTGLFPCGEGAGYAGGIVSAAMDGERSAEAVVTLMGIRK
jgi:hypothetical protein